MWRKYMQETHTLETIPTPAFVVDMKALRKNASILKDVADRSGAHILLAQKAFSCYATYPELAKYLSGTTASGYHEARLGYEEMGKPFGKETWRSFFPSAITSSSTRSLSGRFTANVLFPLRKAPARRLSVFV